MSHFYVEQRTATGRAQRLDDLAQHLQLRYSLGATVVVVEQPRVYVSTLARAWTKVNRQLRRELARRLSADRGPYLREFERMERLVFVAAGTARASAVNETTAVILVEPDALAGLPTSYMTLYVIDEPSEEQRRILEERLMPYGLLVEYFASEQQPFKDGGRA